MQDSELITVPCLSAEYLAKYVKASPHFRPKFNQQRVYIRVSAAVSLLNHYIILPVLIRSKDKLLYNCLQNNVEKKHPKPNFFFFLMKISFNSSGTNTVYMHMNICIFFFNVINPLEMIKQKL